MMNLRLFKALCQKFSVIMFILNLLQCSLHSFLKCLLFPTVMNLEFHHNCRQMFSSMFKSWFGITQSSYNGFMKALLSDDIEAMNHYLNEVIMATFSFFDTGSDCSETDEPEHFYHGFILGLIVEHA